MANYTKRYIKSLIDRCIDRLPSAYLKSLSAVCGIAEISRNACYDILDVDVDVNRLTVCSLGLALEMTYSEFIKLYHYKGFSFRSNNDRDQAVKVLFVNGIFDVEELYHIYNKPLKSDVPVKRRKIRTKKKVRVTELVA